LDFLLHLFHILTVPHAKTDDRYNAD
jgi:hypothetical protein